MFYLDLSYLFLPRDRLLYKPGYYARSQGSPYPGKVPWEPDKHISNHDLQGVILKYLHSYIVI